MNKIKKNIQEKNFEELGILEAKNLQLIQELQKVQRRAVRLVTSDYFNYEEEAIARHLMKLGWKPLETAEMKPPCVFSTQD